ncbi:MAG: hypothetical protein RLO12_21285, partial [Fulvivirga sp.]
ASPELSPYLDCIWTEDYFNEYENRNKPQLIIPDDTIELVFTKESFCRKSINSEIEKEYKTHLCGLKSKSQFIKLQGSPILSVRFKPFGLYYFTRFRMTHTINQSIHPKDIFGSDFTRLEEFVLSNKSISAKLVEVEKYLKLKLFMINKDIMPSVHDFVNNPESAIITRDVYQNFEDVVGMSPAEYARVKNTVQSCKNFIKSGYDDSKFDAATTENMKLSFGIKPEYLKVRGLGIQKPCLELHFA